MEASIAGFHACTAQAEPACPPTAPGSCQIELPQDLLDERETMIDWVIGFAFDTLHARHLDLRIVADPHAP
jgi:hypothetical protein